MPVTHAQQDQQPDQQPDQKSDPEPDAGTIGMEPAISPVVAIAGDAVTITGLTIEDRTLASLLARSTEGDWPEIVSRAVAIGSAGLATMGVGLDIGEIDARVRATLSRATDAGLAAVATMIDEAGNALRSTLDPDVKGSMAARINAELEEVRAEFLAGVDPDRAGSHTAKLLGRLDDLLGPEGLLVRRLESALDPTGDNTGLARTFGILESRIAEIRDLVVETRGRKSEAEAGTKKGLEFEDDLEQRLRETAAQMGALVERTSNRTGDLTANSKVGDFLLELADGTRVVLEAKNSRRIGLLGNDGMLAELDRAIANRGADYAICISANDAFPTEVGSFGVYGNRILLVDDESGTLLRVGLRWVSAVASLRSGTVGAIDPAEISERLERIQQLAQRFSTNRRTLSDIASNVNRVRESLDEMRSDLVELVDDIDRRIRSDDTAPVVEIHRHAV